MTASGYVAGLISVGAMVVRRETASGHELSRLIEPCGGRTTLTPVERRFAKDADRLLRLGGTRCLRRAAVITEVLRRKGVDARIRLTVSAAHPNRAHAEIQIGEDPLRPDRHGHVVLR
jgi:Transglutaminase-like superfamily